MLIFLLIIIREAYSQSAEPRRPRTVDLLNNETTTPIVFAREANDQVLNIEWRLPHATAGSDYHKPPAIEIFGLSAKADRSPFAQLDEATADLLDEPFWPVLLHTHKEFEVRLPPKFVYTLYWTPEDNIQMFLGTSVMARLDAKRLGASFEIDVALNDLKLGDKVVVELDICQGVLGDLEIQYKTNKGPYPLKYRKQRLDGKVLGTPYLIPIEIWNNTISYKVDMFKDETAKDVEVVYRLKFYRVNNNSLVNMIAMHQVMDNIDNPANTKVTYKEESNKISFDLEISKYLLGLHNITNPVSYSVILSSSNSEHLNFRQQCSVDPWAFPSSVQNLRGPTCNKQLVKSEGIFNATIQGQNFAAKKVLFLNSRVFTASSGVVSKTPTVFQTREHWTSSSVDTSDYTYEEKLTIGGIFVLIVILIVILFLLIKNQFKEKRVQISVRSTQPRKPSTPGPKKPTTSTAEEDEESNALNRNVEMTSPN